MDTTAYCNKLTTFISQKINIITFKPNLGRKIIKFIIVTKLNILNQTKQVTIIIINNFMLSYFIISWKLSIISICEFQYNNYQKYNIKDILKYSD